MTLGVQRTGPGIRKRGQDSVDSAHKVPRTGPPPVDHHHRCTGTGSGTGTGPGPGRNFPTRSYSRIPTVHIEGVGVRRKKSATAVLYTW